jgi:hypothetical protein
MVWRLPFYLKNVSARNLQQCKLKKKSYFIFCVCLYFLVCSSLSKRSLKAIRLVILLRSFCFMDDTKWELIVRYVPYVWLVNRMSLTSLMPQLCAHDTAPIFCSDKWPVLRVNLLTVLYLTFSSQQAAVRIQYPLLCDVWLLSAGATSPTMAVIFWTL